MQTIYQILDGLNTQAQGNAASNNSIQGQITALQATVASMQSTITTLQSQIAVLQGEVGSPADYHG